MTSPRRLASSWQRQLSSHTVTVTGLAYTLTVDVAISVCTKSLPCSNLVQSAVGPDALVAQMQQMNPVLASRFGVGIRVSGTPTIRIYVRDISVNTTMQQEASCRPGFWVSSPKTPIDVARDIW